MHHKDQIQQILANNGSTSQSTAYLGDNIFNQQRLNSANYTNSIQRGNTVSSSQNGGFGGCEGDGEVSFKKQITAGFQPLTNSFDDRTTSNQIGGCHSSSAMQTPVDESDCFLQGATDIYHNTESLMHQIQQPQGGGLSHREIDEFVMNQKPDPAEQSSEQYFQQYGQINNLGFALENDSSFHLTTTQTNEETNQKIRNMHHDSSISAIDKAASPLLHPSGQQKLLNNEGSVGMQSQSNAHHMSSYGGRGIEIGSHHQQTWQQSSTQTGHHFQSLSYDLTKATPAFKQQLAREHHQMSQQAQQVQKSSSGVLHNCTQGQQQDQDQDQDQDFEEIQSQIKNQNAYFVVNDDNDCQNDKSLSSSLQEKDKREQFGQITESNNSALSSQQQQSMRNNRRVVSNEALRPYQSFQIRQKDTQMDADADADADERQIQRNFKERNIKRLKGQLQKSEQIESSEGKSDTKHPQQSSSQPFLTHSFQINSSLTQKHAQGAKLISRKDKKFETNKRVPSILGPQLLNIGTRLEHMRESSFNEESIRESRPIQRQNDVICGEEYGQSANENALCQYQGQKIQQSRSMSSGEVKLQQIERQKWNKKSQNTLQIAQKIGVKRNYQDIEKLVLKGKNKAHQKSSILLNQNGQANKVCTNKVNLNIQSNSNCNTVSTTYQNVPGHIASQQNLQQDQIGQAKRRQHTESSAFKASRRYSYQMKQSKMAKESSNSFQVKKVPETTIGSQGAPLILSFNANSQKSQQQQAGTLSIQNLRGSFGKKSRNNFKSVLEDRCKSFSSFGKGNSSFMYGIKELTDAQDNIVSSSFQQSDVYATYNPSQMHAYKSKKVDNENQTNSRKQEQSGGQVSFKLDDSGVFGPQKQHKLSYPTNFSKRHLSVGNVSQSLNQNDSSTTAHKRNHHHLQNKSSMITINLRKSSVKPKKIALKKEDKTSINKSSSHQKHQISSSNKVKKGKESLDKSKKAAQSNNLSLQSEKQIVEQKKQSQVEDHNRHATKNQIRFSHHNPYASITQNPLESNNTFQQQSSVGFNVTDQQNNVSSSLGGSRGGLMNDQGQLQPPSEKFDFITNINRSGSFGGGCFNEQRSQNETNSSEIKKLAELMHQHTRLSNQEGEMMGMVPLEEGERSAESFEKRRNTQKFKCQKERSSLNNLQNGFGANQNADHPSNKEIGMQHIKSVSQIGFYSSKAKQEAYPLYLQKGHKMSCASFGSGQLTELSKLNTSSVAQNKKLLQMNKKKNQQVLQLKSQANDKGEEKVHGAKLSIISDYNSGALKRGSFILGAGGVDLSSNTIPSPLLQMSTDLKQNGSQFHSLSPSRAPLDLIGDQKLVKNDPNIEKGSQINKAFNVVGSVAYSRNQPGSSQNALQRYSTVAHDVVKAAVGARNRRYIRKAIVNSCVAENHLTNHPQETTSDQLDKQNGQKALYMEEKEDDEDGKQKVREKRKLKLKNVKNIFWNTEEDNDIKFVERESVERQKRLEKQQLQTSLEEVYKANDLPSQSKKLQAQTQSLANFSPAEIVAASTKSKNPGGINLDKLRVLASRQKVSSTSSASVNLLHFQSMNTLTQKNATQNSKAAKDSQIGVQKRKMDVDLKGIVPEMTEISHINFGQGSIERAQRKNSKAIQQKTENKTKSSNQSKFCKQDIVKDQQPPKKILQIFQTLDPRKQFTIKIQEDFSSIEAQPQKDAIKSNQNTILQQSQSLQQQQFHTQSNAHRRRNCYLNHDQNLAQNSQKVMIRDNSSLGKNTIQGQEITVASGLSRANSVEQQTTRNGRKRNTQHVNLQEYSLKNCNNRADCNSSWSPAGASRQKNHLQGCQQAEEQTYLKPTSGGKSPKILLFQQEKAQKARLLRQLNKGMLITEQGSDGNEIQKIVFNTVQTLESTDKNQFAGSRSNSVEDWRLSGNRGAKLDRNKYTTFDQEYQQYSGGVPLDNVDESLVRSRNHHHHRGRYRSSLRPDYDNLVSQSNSLERDNEHPPQTRNHRQQYRLKGLGGRVGGRSIGVERSRGAGRHTLIDPNLVGGGRQRAGSLISMLCCYSQKSKNESLMAAAEHNQSFDQEQCAIF